MTRVGKIPSLDGLRAISIFLVIVSHLALSFGRRVPFGSLAARVISFFNLGHLGVMIFFVISGYLITRLLLSEFAESQTINLRRFYFRRTLRIFPPLYALLAVLSVGAMAGLVTVPWRDLWSAAAYVSDYVFPGWYTAHTWSLAVEEQFYLLWPLCFCCTGSRSRRLLCILVICAAPLVRYLSVLKGVHAYEFYRFECVADSLATGCLLALTEADCVRLGEKALFRGVEWLVGAFVVGLALWPSHPSICPVALYATIGTSVINIGVGVIVFCVVTRIDGTAAKILNLPGVAAVGVLSYSLYLWQQCFTNPDFSSSGWHIIISVASIGVAASLSYWLIERPSLKLRAIWERRIFGGKVVESLREKTFSFQTAASE